LTDELTNRAPGGDPAPAIHVAAAVLFDRRSRVLIAQRPPGKHLAGAWEFPGGKLEPGETRTAGLARELKEELGIQIEHPRPLLRLRHTYPYGEVLLDVWVVRRYRGEPQGLDGQALRWCPRGELPSADLLPADRPILAALRLPERLRRTDTAFYELHPFRSEAGRGASDAGGGGRAEGSSRDGRGGSGSEPSPPRLRGVLCEDVREAESAAAAGADFIAMRRPLGPNELEALCERLSPPVFARGTTLERAWARGASGVNAVADTSTWPAPSL
jgi:mutator protein MutT